ncbi:MAG: hypothetical protein ACI9GM_001320 [Salibacteraceae bacterium]|jgi:hypothetical protein
MQLKLVFNVKSNSPEEKSSYIATGLALFTSKISIGSIIFLVSDRTTVVYEPPAKERAFFLLSLGEQKTTRES